VLEQVMKYRKALWRYRNRLRTLPKLGIDQIKLKGIKGDNRYHWSFPVSHICYVLNETLRTHSIYHFYPILTFTQFLPSFNPNITQILGLPAAIFQKS
jgi:hypothetical protein